MLNTLSELIIGHVVFYDARLLKLYKLWFVGEEDQT